MSTQPQNNPQAIIPNAFAPQPVFPVPQQATPTDWTCLPPQQACAPQPMLPIPQQVAPSDCNCSLPPLPYYAQPDYQAPSPRNPAYGYAVYSASSGITYPGNLTGSSCALPCATIPGGNTIVVQMNVPVVAGSTIRICAHVCSGTSGGIINVYQGTSGTGPFTFAGSANVTSTTPCTQYPFVAPITGQFIAISIISGCVCVCAIISS